MTELLDISGASEDQKIKILELASDIRKFEIGLFWQRSLFFWGFLVSAFIAYSTLHESDEQLMRITVACFGLVCSIAWTLQNRGSKYWQEAWEQKVETVEKAVLGCDLFSHSEPRKRKGWWGAWRFSVSGLTIALSDFSVLVWGALLVATFTGNLIVGCECAVVSMILVSLSYALVAAICNFRSVSTTDK